MLEHDVNCAQYKAQAKYDAAWPWRCLTCKGKGTVEVPLPPPTPFDSAAIIECPDCVGRGICPRCGGDNLDEDCLCLTCGWDASEPHPSDVACDCTPTEVNDAHQPLPDPQP